MISTHALMEDAHFNPAVTMAWIILALRAPRRLLPARLPQGLAYILAQVTGSAGATYLLHALYHHTPVDHVADPLAVAVIEAAGTCIITLAFLCTKQSTALGMIITAIAVTSTPIAGAYSSNLLRHVSLHACGGHLGGAGGAACIKLVLDL